MHLDEKRNPELEKNADVVPASSPPLDKDTTTDTEEKEVK